MNQLKYQRTPDGVHIWRYPDGNIFCAASGNQKEATTCYPLAKQFVDGATANPQPSPNPSPVDNQPGDPLSLVMVVLALACTIVGGVSLSYVLSPAPKLSPKLAPNEPEPNEPEPISLNPDSSGRSEGSGSENGHERSENGHERSPQGSDKRSGSTVSYAQMPLSQFKELVPAGSIDPRTLSLSEYRELGKELIWEFYQKHGVTNREKLAWITTGATKGGSIGWTLTSDFLKDVCNVLFTYGYTSKYKVSDGGF